MAVAAPPEPAGPHPRILLDAGLRRAWQAAAKLPRGPVHGAIALCDDAASNARYERAVYQGSEWAKVLQACLVAWAATNRDDFARTAIRFHTALLDDRDRIGDGLGGDGSARRNHGYAIRNVAPYTAIAYDWLHEKMPPALLETTRQRWNAWLSWYADSGYRARVPGSNYHAGYLLAATLIAVAQAHEAGEPGAELWRNVADELWAKDMAKALAPGGILDGGDWPEGWQYGPLAVASYALAARVVARAGVPVPGIDSWLHGVLRRHVYGLSPRDQVFAGGDTEERTANIRPYVNTLNAIALGDASSADRQYALGELQRLRLIDGDYLLFDALASVSERPAFAPRAQWPTSYLASTTGTFFVRTRWDAASIWFVAECKGSLGLDHRHPKAGNFVLSRGSDDLIVDPSPYGSQSTLTSNAPTVASAQLPENYAPSQAVWGDRTQLAWARQTRSGVALARCDYADQYRFQDKPSDIALAQRDFVLLPSADGRDATLVVIDRARTEDEAHAMYVKFRAPVPLAVSGSQATAAVGGSKLAIDALPPLRPTARSSAGRDCYDAAVPRGKCEAARFPVWDLQSLVPGPTPRAIHVIHALAADRSGHSTPISGDTWDGVIVSGARDAAVIAPRASGAIRYRVPRDRRMTEVLLDASPGTLRSHRSGDACELEFHAVLEHPSVQVVELDPASCVATVEPDGAVAAPASQLPPPPTPQGRAPWRRVGCCDAGAEMSGSIGIAVVGLGFVLRRRRRRAR